MNLRFLTALGVVLIAIGFCADVHAGDGDLVPPKLLYEEEAQYTDEAIEAGVEGRVVLDIQIDADGDVAGVEILEGLGYGLDEAAKEAAKNFAFRPAMLDGEPISVVLDFAIEFSLPDLPADFEGVVVDPDTGDGIGDARVSISYIGDERDPPPQATTSTDDDGAFYFGNVPSGPYEVSLRLDEYRDFDTDIDLIGGQTVEVEYSVPARDDNVVGRIREAGTRNPLAAMELELLDADTQEVIREGFTESGGAFSFRGVPEGEYILRVLGPDHVTASFELDVVEGEMTRGSFYVRAEDYGGLTVRTTERRERAEVDRQTIRLEEARRIPGAGTDVVRVVENLPGVARQAIGATPIIRGAAPQDTEIFLEGDTIPLAFHFLGGPAVVHTEMIEAVDFYPGNFSPRFGRATAGIIDLQTRSPRTDRFHGFTEIDLLDASTMIEGPISDNWSFALAARRSYYDLFLPSLMERAGSDTFFSPRYYDYQGWTTYRSSDGDHKVEFFVYGSNDRIDLLLAEGQPEGTAQVSSSEFGFDTFFDRGQARWEWTPDGSDFESSLMASLGRNRVGFALAENLFFELEFLQTQLRYDTRYQLTEDLILRSGVDTMISTGTAAYEIPAFDSTPDDQTGDGQNDPPNISEQGLRDETSDTFYYPAVYAEVDYRLFERLRLLPGLRVDYYSEIDDIAVSPRFSTRYTVNDEVVAKGGVGLFTQPPLPGQSDALVGNPNITFERAIHYAVGAEWQPSEYLELDSTLFFRDNRDLVDVTPEETIDEDGQRQATVFDNEGRGRAYGWEVLLRHYPRNDFFGWVSYTLSRSQRFNRNTERWELFHTDQTHILTVALGYTLFGNLDITGRFRLVTGNPQTPIVGGAYDADRDMYRPHYGPPNSVRASTFNALDLRLDRRFVFSTWQMSAYLDITNVYNATNPEGMQYNYDYSESAPLRGIPFLPTIGISARY